MFEGEPSGGDTVDCNSGCESEEDDVLVVMESGSTIGGGGDEKDADGDIGGVTASLTGCGGGISASLAD